MRENVEAPIPGGFNAVEKAALLYHLGVLLLPGIQSVRMGFPLAPFLFNAFALFFLLMLRRYSVGRTHPGFRFLRDFHPLFFFLPIYEQVGMLNRLFIKQNLDPLLQKADQILSGMQPSVELARAFPGPWISEFMHFSYFNFYWIFTALALILAYRHPRPLFRKYMSALCFTFYACNFLFIFLPALGPSAFVTDEIAPRGFVFEPLMRFIYQFEISGGLFPSSHVALTAVAMWYSLSLKTGRSLFLVLGASLILSTVYCGYHYAVDVLGGVAVAAFFILLVNFFPAEKS